MNFKPKTEKTKSSPKELKLIKLEEIDQIGLNGPKLTKVDQIWLNGPKWIEIDQMGLSGVK